MSLLCICVQNSQTMVGSYADDALSAHWRVSTDDRWTADDWGLLISSLLTGGRGLSAVDGLCICSAVPAALHELRATAASYLPDAHTVIVGAGVKSGLPVLTDNPREVGTDRIAHAVAALDGFGAPCVVVDFGAATTFDVVNGASQYVGGAIAPGVQLSADALSTRGAQLRQVELTSPRSVIAKNTVEALQAGVVFGFAGLVDGIVGRIIDELGCERTEVEVIATGELMDMVFDHCGTLTRREPWLAIEGLRLIFDRNS